MEQTALKTERRTGAGTAAARRLRAEGKVPAVLYGHGEGTVHLALTAEAAHGMVHSGHLLVSLEVDGSRQRALIKDIQWDPWGREVLHVDFARVALDERVTVTVPIVSHGTPKAAMAGGVLEQPLYAVEVSCAADLIPDEIVVEVGEMEIGDTVHVSDLPLPAGVDAETDADGLVFVLQEPRVVEEEEAPEAEAGAEEPELIGRGKEGEEAGEGEAAAS